MENRNEDDVIETEEEEEEVTIEEPKPKRAKTLTAECWKYFTKIGAGEDGIERAACNACNQEYKCGGKQYGTLHLNRHIKSCSKIKFEDVGQMMIDMQGKVRTHKIDHMVSREMCALAIIEHDLPFSFVEYGKIRDWIKYLNPDAIPITRNTAKCDVLKIYTRKKENLKQILASIPNRICLTSDLWTSCTTEGYICLTAHFVDLNWKLQSKILNFCHMPPPHNGFEISQVVHNFLKQWEIEKKIFFITLDNASSNDNMVRNLKSQLGVHNWLLCDGQFFHVCCSAHILNLIVQEGLKVAADAIYKIRESVKYVKGSEGRMNIFKECMVQVGLNNTSAGLRLDVPTRWNSTYMMLESVIKYQRAFSILELRDKNYKFCPSEEDWQRGERLRLFLKPFCAITKLISGTSYPTSNLYFLQIWQIHLTLKNAQDDDDDVVLKTMAQKMIEKFEKYWNEYSVVLALGALLDPRLKLSSLEYCYRSVNSITVDEKVETIRSNAYLLFEKYASSSSSNIQRQSERQGNNITNTSSSSSSVGKKSFSQNMIRELKMHNHNHAVKLGKSQLDIYLEEGNIDFEDDDDDIDSKFDVLKWWKQNSSRLPNLSLMARDVLSIPITTVASESAFSIGSRVLNKYRSSLLPECVEALLCTRNWRNGFGIAIDEVDTNNTNEENSLRVTTA